MFNLSENPSILRSKAKWIRNFIPIFKKIRGKFTLQFENLEDIFTVRDPEFPRGGRQPQRWRRKPIILNIFSKKLHDNINLDPGGAQLWRHLGFANASCLLYDFYNTCNPFADTGARPHQSKFFVGKWLLGWRPHLRNSGSTTTTNHDNLPVSLTTCWTSWRWACLAWLRPWRCDRPRTACRPCTQSACACSLVFRLPPLRPCSTCSFPLRSLQLVKIPYLWTMTGNNSGSCFGFRGPVCRLWVPVFCYAPQILVMCPFFRNSPTKYCNAPVHYEKQVHYKKMNGGITKKTGT